MSTPLTRFARRPVAVMLATSLVLFSSSYAASLGAPFQSKSPAEARFFQAFAAATVERTRHVVRYDPAYIRIPYPGGDVPSSTGVCTDEVIRAYRAVGVDLQKEVHDDMLAHRSAYPHKWAASPRNGDGTDTNIDHRRVPNLMAFFKRKGQSLATSLDGRDYQPGDVVAWNLGGGITHIGIVVDQKSADGERYLIVHNIGAGPRMEDALFSWKIIGHYRYWPSSLN